MCREDNDPHAVTLDVLPGADFRGLAALGMAIDADRARRNQLFALPAAVSHASQFQQVAEPDVIVAQLEFSNIHGWAIPDQRQT